VQRQSSASEYTGKPFLGDGFQGVASEDEEGYGESGDEADAAMLLTGPLSTAQLDCSEEADDVVEVADGVVDLTGLHATAGELAAEAALVVPTDEGGVEEQQQQQAAIDLEQRRNPAEWPSHLFKEKKDRTTKNSKGFSLPTGIHVAPLNDQDQRRVGDYEFRYSPPGERVLTGNPSRTLVEDGEGQMRALGRP